MVERLGALPAALLAALLGFGCTATVAGDLEPAGTGEDDPNGDIGEDGDFDPGTTPDFCEGDFDMNTLEPVAPTVQLLIDVSGSMDRDFAGNSRWHAVKHAVADATVGVVPALASEIYFGATLYHSDRGNSGGRCAKLDTELPQLDNAARIEALLDRGNPHEDTPTAEAVDEIAATLTEAVAGSRRFIVLATDGNPDTCVDPDAHSVESQIGAENAVDRARAAGITTLVLSVGDDITREHLRRVANLGAGEPVYTGTAPYYQADDPAQLITELEALLMETLTTCSFTVPGTLNQGDAASATVELDGDLLDFGTDWRWVDSSTIELVGAACDRVQADPTLPVNGRFPCG